jgi:hypothetical protein
MFSGQQFWIALEGCGLNRHRASPSNQQLP